MREFIFFLKNHVGRFNVIPLCTLRITDNLIMCRTTKRLRSQLILSNYFGYKSFTFPRISYIVSTRMNAAWYWDGFTVTTKWSEHFATIKRVRVCIQRVFQKVVVCHNTLTLSTTIMSLYWTLPNTLLHYSHRVLCLIVMCRTCAGLAMQCTACTRHIQLTQQTTHQYW